MTPTASVYGKDTFHEDLSEYAGSDAYKGQKDKRIVKHLFFSFLVEAPNPAMASGPPVLKERVAYQGDVVTVEELGTMALERGERLGSFYTDAELAGTKPEAIEAGEEVPDNFAEWGVPELTEYIEKNKPNVSDTVALCQGDPEAAQRVLEAETVATNGDPRSGVVKGLSAVAGDGQ